MLLLTSAIVPPRIFEVKLHFIELDCQTSYNAQMRSFLTWLSKRRFPYQPLISVEISRANILHNLHAFIRIAPQHDHFIAPVLKSNAYGHGLIEVASILERARKDHPQYRERLPFFVVDSYFEAVALRSHGIRTPVLVIGYTRPEIIRETRLPRVSFAVTSLETLKAIRNNGLHRISVHLKIDTGMHRQGILEHEIEQALDMIAEFPHIHLDGICSHLADADTEGSDSTLEQIAIWNRVVSRIRQEVPDIRYVHLAASYGHRYSARIEANTTRLGIGLYGLADDISPFEKHDLRPAMSLKTILTSVKHIRVGDTVGYNNTFQAERDMTIATIPVGYAEGLDRRLSNTGFVLVGPDEIPCRIIGRISMNIASVDVSAVPHSRAGMSVIVISNMSDDPNSMAAMARSAGTIPYELAVHIPSQLKRSIV